MAPKTIKVTVSGVDRKRSCLLFVKGTEASVVLCTCLSQLHVLADNAHDIGLLLDELGKVIGHR